MSVTQYSLSKVQSDSARNLNALTLDNFDGGPDDLFATCGCVAMISISGEVSGLLEWGTPQVVLGGTAAGTVAVFFVHRFINNLSFNE